MTDLLREDILLRVENRLTLAEKAFVDRIDDLEVILIRMQKEDDRKIWEAIHQIRDDLKKVWSDIEAMKND